MPKHSVLVIGCGSIGERHLRCFQNTGRASVAGVDTVAAVRSHIATRYGVDAIDDWRTAVQSGRYTAAVICTPAPCHVEMAIEALRRGLHVLIEKPLSQSMQGIPELLATRDGSGRQAAVAYVFHVFPALTEVRSWLKSGAIGPVLQAVVSAGQPFHRLRPAYASTYYRDRQTGGGAIQDALTHPANWIESVLGPTESVLCDCQHLAVPGVDVEDTVHVSARHAGAVCNYSLNQFQAPNETFIQLNAADASVRIEIHRQRWGTFRPGADDWDWQPARVMERDSHFVAQANAFLDQVEGRPPRLCSLEAGIQSLRFNLAALASADTGTRVSCASVG